MQYNQGYMEQSFQEQSPLKELILDDWQDNLKVVQLIPKLEKRDTSKQKNTIIRLKTIKMKTGDSLVNYKVQQNK